MENKNPTGIFEYLSDGLFSSTNSNKNREEIIERYAGPLRGDVKEMLEDEWGTREYFEKEAEKRGEKRGEERGEKNGVRKVIPKFIKILMDQGMSEEEARKALQAEGVSLD